MSESVSRRHRHVAIPPLLTGYLLGMLGTVVSALALLALASNRTGTGIILAVVAVVLFISGYATYRLLRATVSDDEIRAAASAQLRSTYERHYPHEKS